ncbi:DUF3806 domain-containing protein [Myroides marinus]|uniref:DUF3806 domain-containing protein n=1 Tax=Myroides marinus TaxID=703342 RepID=UPI002575951D|nr:DUF3806 domain-containing protein [Myroides marinus]MDM1371267.1 DUF3806 domain-containing protein [Myroides marinus]MDM1391018.1 DUF3806 domain-containing protein [Myroides marinus]MDM1403440.1 DUF3806 domain-containing protein [Myroides marinus]
MKVFEIGNGQTVIKGPSHYYSCSEGDSTVMLYKGEEEDEPVIRFSIIYFQRAEGITQKDIINDFKEKAARQNAQFITHSGKSFFSYDSESQEDLYIRIFEIMYEENIIVVSLTATNEDKGTDKIKVYLEEITDMIKSIDSLASLKFPILEPRYEDIDYLVTEVTKVLDVPGEKIAQYHESGKSVEILQDILTRRDYAINDYKYHCALGLLFGDCLQAANNSFHWVIVHDQYGRELALQYQDFALQCFPISMITKRIEDEVEINVTQLMDEVITHIESESDKDKGFTRIEHNF